MSINPDLRCYETLSWFDEKEEPDTLPEQAGAPPAADIPEWPTILGFLNLLKKNGA